MDLFLFFLIVVVPLLGLLYAWRVWRSGRLGKSVIAIAPVALACLVYRGLFPPESFYVDAIKNFANLRVPADAVFSTRKPAIRISTATIKPASWCA